MNDLPSPDRYFVAHSAVERRPYTEAELRKLFGDRVILSGTMVAPVNTSAWKRLGEVFPDWGNLTVQPPAVPLIDGGRTGAGPPFAPGPNRNESLVLFLLAGGAVMLVVALEGKSVGWLVGSMTTILTAIAFQAAGASAARQEAILAALNWMIAGGREIKDKAGPEGPDGSTGSPDGSAADAGSPHSSILTAC